MFITLGFITTLLLLVPLNVCGKTQKSNNASLKLGNSTKNLRVNKPFLRLPNTSLPLSYEIDLKADIQVGVFQGTVKIQIRIQEDTSRVVLHSKDLKIEEVRFVKLGNKTEEDEPRANNASFSLDAGSEFLNVDFDKGDSSIMTKGDVWTLTIVYSGKLGSNDEGFFRKVFEGHSKKEMYLAATHFEPISARRAFPCYDEPGYKATFQLNITHNKKYVAVSNMPTSEDPVDNLDGTCTTSFLATPKMSTYMLAFAIGDFKSHYLKDSRPQISVTTRAGYRSHSEYALQMSSKILSALERYTNQSYPFTKLDNLAISEYKWKAMENWALIIYDENSLLTLRERSKETEWRIAFTIAHELTHQWFGNLVTPVWWSYVWLSEGLTSYLEFHILKLIFVDLNFDQWFVMSKTHVVLAEDTNQTYHPLTYWPHDLAGIRGIFDYITYHKGACIFRMIEHVLTKDAFQKALRNYLADRKYRSVSSDIIFQYFTDAAVQDGVFENTEIDFQSFLSTWTLQSGYPLVTVVRDYDSGTFRLQQEPFDTIGRENKNDTRIWWIPFNYVTKNMDTFEVTTADGYLDSSGEQTISPALKMWTNEDWLILNKQQTGFYRVNYDPRNWALITGALLKNHTSIHVLNRAQLMDDAYHLMTVNRLPVNVFLNLLKYMVKEDEYAPWKTFESVLGQLRRRLPDRQDSIGFDNFLRDVTTVPYERFGLLAQPKDDFLRHLTRKIVINLACYSGHEECLHETKALLNKILLNKTKKINNDAKSTILCNGMKSATHQDFSLVLSLFVKSRDKYERKEYMECLGCMMDANLIRLYLTTAMKKTFDIKYTVDERLYVLKSVIQAGRIGLRVAIEFLIENTVEYSKISAGKRNALQEAVQEVGRYIVNKKLQMDFTRLLKKVKRYSLLSEEHTKPIENTVQRNIIWADRHRKPIIEWFSTYNYDKTSKTVAVTSGALIGGEISWIILGLNIISLYLVRYSRVYVCFW